MIKLCTWGVVPIVTLADATDTDRVADALVEGGIPCAEVTLRTRAAFAVIERMAARGDVHVGVGTVTTPDQVERAAGLGARFVVSPGYDEAVVERTLERGLVPLPGVATSSELTAAVRAGLSTVKLFPAAVLGGPAMVQALAGPFPDVQLVPSGGIRLDDLPAYLSLPTVPAVGASWLTAPGLSSAQLLRQVVATVAAVHEASRPTA